MAASNYRILIVDDHLTSRMKLSFAVKQLGFDADTAENGREALDKLRDQSFDLILLDLLMPEMDGYEVLVVLKEDAGLQNIPVVVISALDEVKAVARAIELGAADHLPKHFDLLLLQARMGACLEQKRLRDLEIEYLRQVEHLTEAAGQIEHDGFKPDELNLGEVSSREDALGQLARVFLSMAHQVFEREQVLRDQVKNLQIEIDERRQEQQVNTITDTDYFKELRGQAGDLRTMLNEGDT